MAVTCMAHGQGGAEIASERRTTLTCTGNERVEAEAMVAQPIAFHPSQDPISSTDGTTHGLGCGSSGGQASVAVSYGVRTANTSSNGWGIQEEVTHTLDCAQGVAVAQPIVASMGMSGHANRPAVMTVFRAMAVRRLTPVECERLQGFPDNYTNIPWRSKPESPDGPRYKALGNSWAVPVVTWIGKRIAAATLQNSLPKIF